MAAVTVASTSRVWNKTSTQNYWVAKAAFVVGTNIYVVTQDTGASPKLRVHKSALGGTLSFSEQDSANAITVISATQPFSAWATSAHIHVVYFSNTNVITHRRFDLSSDTWTTGFGNPHSATWNQDSIRVVVRSDDDVLVFLNLNADSADNSYSRYEGTSWTTTAILTTTDGGASAIIDATIDSSDVAHATWYDANADDLGWTSVTGGNTLTTVRPDTAVVAADASRIGGSFEQFTESSTPKWQIAYADSDGTLDSVVLTLGASASLVNAGTLQQIETTTTDIGANTIAITARVPNTTADRIAVWWDDANSGTFYYSIYLDASSAWDTNVAWKTQSGGDLSSTTNMPAQIVTYGSILYVLYQDGTDVKIDQLALPVINTRTLTSNTIGIQTLQKRVVSSVAGIQKINTRTLTGLDVGIATLNTRTLTANKVGIACLLTRTLTTNKVGIQQINTRTLVTNTVGIQRIKARAVFSSVGIQQINTRIVSSYLGVSVTATNTRTLTANVVGIQQVNTRTLTGLVVGVQTLQAHIVTSFAGIQQINTRVVTSYAGINTQATFARTVTSFLGVQQINTRIVGSVAGIQTQNVRTISSIAGIATLHLRTISSAAGVSTLNARIVASFAGIQKINTRTILSFAGIAEANTNTRSVTSFLGVQRVNTRIVTSDAGIATLQARIVTSFAGIATLHTRVVISVMGIDTASVRTVTSIIAIQTRNARMVQSALGVQTIRARIVESIIGVATQHTRNIESFISIAGLRVITSTLSVQATNTHTISSFLGITVSITGGIGFIVKSRTAHFDVGDDRMAEFTIGGNGRNSRFIVEPRK